MLSNYLQLLLTSLLFGFGCWSILLFFLFKSHHIQKANVVVEWTTKVVGIVYGLTFVVWLIDSWFLVDDSTKYLVSQRLFGRSAFAIWLQFLIPLFSTQILWFKKLRSFRYLRLVLGLLLLIILVIEKLIILVTSLHRDYIDSGWTYAYPLGLNYVYQLIIFVILNATIYYLYKVVKKLKNLR